MQGATSYTAKRGSPTALTIVVLLHGAAIGALALAKMDVIPKNFGKTDVYHVPLEQIPPPEPPKPVEKVVETPQHVSRVTTPPVIIPTPTHMQTMDTSPVTVPPVFEYTRPAETYIAPPPPPPPPPPPARTVEPARAKANLASYISDADYPAAAIRGDEQGRTSFRLTVGTDGRVKECSIVASSGSSSLDSATCRIMKARAKFTPAKNSNDQVVTDTVQSSIKWVLPED